ncbi:MAG: acylphosphatase [Planctomycetota bacterium]
MSAARLLARGVVQGVGYRWSTVRAAEPLGLVGWVRNLPDGSVEIFAQGPDEALDALERWAQQGPPPARVSAVERAPAPEDPSLRGFEIRRG